MLLNIRTLAEAPECLPTLARWFHQEWHDFDGRSVDAIVGQLSENLFVDRIPITFIAYSDLEVVGTASLDGSDLPAFEHLSPWLASLYVVPKVRRVGIGTALVQHVQQFARARGIASLYLWTPGATNLYEKCDWTMLQRTVYNSRPITIMHTRLTHARTGG